MKKMCAARILCATVGLRKLEHDAKVRQIFDICKFFRNFAHKKSGAVASLFAITSDDPPIMVRYSLDIPPMERNVF